MRRIKQAVSVVALAIALTVFLPAFAPDALPWVVMALTMLVLGRRNLRRSDDGMGNWREPRA